MSLCLCYVMKPDRAKDQISHSTLIIYYHSFSCILICGIYIQVLESQREFKLQYLDPDSELHIAWGSGILVQLFHYVNNNVCQMKSTLSSSLLKLSYPFSPLQHIHLFPFRKGKNQPFHGQKFITDFDCRHQSFKSLCKSVAGHVVFPNIN